MVARFSAAALGVFLLGSELAGGVARAATPPVQPLDFSDPQSDAAPYTGGSNPVLWRPQALSTEDPFARTEQVREIERQADMQRHLMEQNHQMMVRNAAEELNRFRQLERAVRKPGVAPKQLYLARLPKAIHSEPLRFTGKRAGPGMIEHLAPAPRTARGTPTFGLLSASAGGSTFSFGSALQGSASTAKPFHFNLNQ
jgi:hypothetical protein